MPSGKNILKFTPNLLKKIFILIPWFRPAYKAGGPIQSIANMVGQLAVGYEEELTKKNEPIEFKIFCSNKDLDGSLLQGIESEEWVRYNTNTKAWYCSENNILPVLQDAIKKEKPDYLFIVGIYDLQFNLKPLLFCKGVNKIVSVRGMLHPGALSQKSFKKRIYLGLWKIMGLHKKVVFHATDVEEKKYIEDVFGNAANIKVAANFPRVFNVQPVVKKEPGQLKLVSVALISPMKNILMVLEALGNVSGESSGVSGEREKKSFELLAASGEEETESNKSPVVSGQSSVIDSIEYNIYGPVKDKQYWDECLACIKKLPASITVNYHGDILPDKIEGALASNHVFILPSKSENYGHSIIEALYAGRPVITSNNTPWNELDTGKAGINISLADKQELVNAINVFAGMNQKELATWSKGARDYAEKAINMEAIMQQYEEMFG